MDLNEKYSVKRLYEMAETGELASLDGTAVTVGGFVRTNRTFGDIGFLSVNDGSCFKNIQIVTKPETRWLFRQSLEAPSRQLAF